MSFFGEFILTSECEQEALSKLAMFWRMQYWLSSTCLCVESGVARATSLPALRREEQRTEWRKTQGNEDSTGSCANNSYKELCLLKRRSNVTIWCPITLLIQQLRYKVKLGVVLTHHFQTGRKYKNKYLATFRKNRSKMILIVIPAQRDSFCASVALLNSD